MRITKGVDGGGRNWGRRKGETIDEEGGRKGKESK